MSKQDVIARSLNSRREVVYKCNKHILYIQQVVKAYRTQKDNTYTPVKTTKVCIVVNTSERETIHYHQVRHAIFPALCPGSYVIHRPALN